MFYFVGLFLVALLILWVAKSRSQRRPNERQGERIEVPLVVKFSSMTEPLQVGSLSLQSSVTVERDEVLAELNRLATDAKAANDWPRAVGLLQQAKRHLGTAYQDTRLAMYLQQAGRFDEAMKEFDWLLSMVPAQCDASTVPMSAAYRRYRIALLNAAIHNKIRIAASREKRVDLVSRHQVLYEEYEAETAKLKPVIEREWKKERATYSTNSKLISGRHK